MSEQNAFRLDGEVALITGGGTGLGLAMAKAMGEAGATVVIVGRREQQLQLALESLGHEARYLVHDVTDVKAAPALIDAVTNLMGAGPSILVNNAGIHLKKWAVDTTEEEFQKVLNTHVTGSFALTRAAAKKMIQNKHGSILFIASMATLIGIPQVVAYSAAKSALGGMVRTLATEFSQHNVRVNAIAPGWIETDMSRGAFASDPKRAERVLQRTPMQKFGHVDDIGYAAVYLSSPAAKFVTGVMLPVDGGVSIGF